MISENKKQHVSIIKNFIPFILLMLSMYIIHRYVYIYADDLYYSRDIQNGISYLPKLMWKELNVNGRVWVHVLLSILVKYDAVLYRIINPIIITLGAVLIAKISNKDRGSNKILPAAVVSSLLFLAIPTQIANTTLYYAACALNYLYPTLVSILFGYIFLIYYSKEKNLSKINFGIIVLGFFAASSTQQAGAIGIGYIVLMSLYIAFMKGYKLKAKYFINFIPLVLGYGLVTFGSLKRMLLEKDSGVVIKISETIMEILKTNIFSKPVSIFTILILICLVIWIIKFSREYQHNKTLRYFNILLAIALLISSLCYIYVVIIKGYKVEVITLANITSEITLFYLGFTVIYIFSMLYVGTLILLNKKNPFILASIINAIGAQVMLLVADSRFASAYKIIFPSQLLMFIFICYTFSELYYEKSINLNKVIFYSLIIPFTVIAFRYYFVNYNGYKSTSSEIEYNLNMIEEYQKSSDKSSITLKKVPPSIYGYNLGNWNKMPYFMKQCYKINEDTIINYIE
ncbi:MULTISPECIES: DUF6056 family protein [Clostridium]|uniref:DUF6056 family protein n=1 Tax=Clostridium TaxID=1485 RepID=UPI00189C17B3|nr:MULTISPECIES: DUF6056 family protein [Clostridium]MDI9217015.1 DUF6056 family protein [Clostridium tertium]